MTRPGPVFAGLAALLLLALSAAAATPQAGPRPGADGEGPTTLSGRRLLGFCDGVTAGKSAAPALETARCVGYFQGALDTLQSLKGLGRISVCPPPGLSVMEAILLYKKEAAIFPHVLDRPASDLIAGMVVKFFPCE